MCWGLSSSLVSSLSGTWVVVPRLLWNGRRLWGGDLRRFNNPVGCARSFVCALGAGEGAEMGEELGEANGGGFGTLDFGV